MALDDPDFGAAVGSDNKPLDCGPLNGAFLVVKFAGKPRREVGIAANGFNPEKISGLRRRLRLK